MLALLAFVGWPRRQGAAIPALAASDLSGQPSLGSPSAKATVVVFEDFKCPNCQRYDQTIFPQLKQNYLDTGKVRYVFVSFPLPLGQDSYTAAVAAECVYDQNPALFWPYKELVFRGQKAESTTWATPQYLTELGSYVDGVNVENLRRCLQADAPRQRVDADRQLGVAAGVNGTPSVFVNGVKTPDYAYDTVARAIDAALASP